MNSYDKIKFLELRLEAQGVFVTNLQAEIAAVRSEVNMLKGINTSRLQEMLELRQYIQETIAKSLAKVPMEAEVKVSRPTSLKYDR